MISRTRIQKMRKKCYLIFKHTIQVSLVYLEWDNSGWTSRTNKCYLSRRGLVGIIELHLNSDQKTGRKQSFFVLQFYGTMRFIFWEGIMCVRVGKYRLGQCKRPGCVGKDGNFYNMENYDEMKFLYSILSLGLIFLNENILCSDLGGSILVTMEY